MIFNPAEALAVQGVFVFPKKSSPHWGLCHFSLKNSPCCTELMLLLQSLKIWWQTPFGNYTLYIPWGAPCFGGRFLFHFPIQSQAWAQLRSSWMSDLHCKRNFPFQLSLALPPPPVNVTPLLLIPALTSCFQLNSSDVQFISLICLHQYNDLCYQILSPGWRGLCLFAGLVELDIYLDIKVAFWLDCLFCCFRC